MINKLVYKLAIICVLLLAVLPNTYTQDEEDDEEYYTEEKEESKGLDRFFWGGNFSRGAPAVRI